MPRKVYVKPPAPTKTMFVAMIVVGKQLFGGVGSYPFNPVLIGWAVLLLGEAEAVAAGGPPCLPGFTVGRE